MADDPEVWIDYTNWRGERRVRKIRPSSIMFSSNEWHTETQWFVYAFDCEDYNRPLKSFAMSGIHRWSVTPIAVSQ